MDNNSSLKVSERVTLRIQQTHLVTNAIVHGSNSLFDDQNEKKKQSGAMLEIPLQCKILNVTFNVLNASNIDNLTRCILPFVRFSHVEPLVQLVG